jgi:diguanylate cyclase (GGDEF)-like protein/PAS domain S-box-containing protein
LSVGCALVAVCALVVLQLHHSRAAIQAREQSRLASQAKIIAENLAHQLQGVSNALSGVRYDVALADHTDGQQLRSVALKVLTDALPGVRGIVVLDANGAVVLSDRRGQTVADYAEGGTLKLPMDSPNYSMLYVSTPFKSSKGSYSIHLTKAFADADGRFAGAVSATLDPEYFETLVHSVLYAPRMIVNIIHGDGTLFADAPVDQRALGSNVSSGTMFARHVASGQTQSVLQGRVRSTDEDRMMALHTVFPAELQMDKPLIVTASRTLADVYAPWREEVRLYAALLGVLGISAVLVLHLSQQRRRAANQAVEEIRALERENAKRFEFGLRGADLGLWDWNVQTDALTVNARELQMLGYSEGEIDLKGDIWHKLIHPDDRRAVYTAFQAHIRSTRSGHTFEHRMLHKNGSIIWVLSHAMVLEQDAQGRPSRILGTHLDISQRKRAEAVLKESAQRLELAMKTGNLGFIDWHVPSGALVINPRGQEILGLPATGPVLDIEGWRRLRHPEDMARAEETLQAMLRGEAPTCICEYRVQHAGGAYIWIHVRAEMVERDAEGAPLRVMGTYRDTTERVQFEADLQRANDQLARLTLTDGLTGVGNRRLFDQKLAAEWLRCARQPQPLSLLLVDIDHFKLYNDHYGHQGGDEVLKRVAAILAHSVQRSGEIVARYGGEEFAILLPGSGPSAAAAVARACLAQLSEARIAHAASPVSPWLTLSIGIASAVPDATEAPESLVAAADGALYSAKRRGRSRVEHAAALEN